MLKAEVQDKNVKLEAKGTTMQIVEDFAVAIKGIYLNYLGTDGVQALGFRAMMQRIMADDSPVWSKEGTKDFSGVVYEIQKKK